jgi:hypothetical protein
MKEDGNFKDRIIFAKNESIESIGKEASSFELLSNDIEDNLQFHQQQVDKKEIY